ncbi:hypothetical protein [Sanguibacter suaedae]|uniref:Uncharacterized protein n=1 Tax=Sanguibacter suaedae TaxID=2795737 RepID=A0A934M9R0_9MICO|nr:hypothetical protein [Sanguibacter suaedae]MBI9113426.1 hypothetical protein [Sanguibacter suaedae]
MEILPGIGVGVGGEAVRIGDARDAVERVTGPSDAGALARKVAYGPPTNLVVHYAPDRTVEAVAVGYGEGDEATYDGVHLTGRFLDDVLADLAARGLTSTPSDIGRDFHAGFSVFSMSSAYGADLGLTDGGDDERLVSEGVHVAPYATFAQPA